MRLPDGAGSRAVLIGTSRFTGPDLPDLPAVSNNLTSLEDVLTSPSGTGLPAEHCRVLLNSTNLAEVGDELATFAEQARDLMLVYYSGHGVVDRWGRLNLALPGTRHNRMLGTALALSHLREVLVDCPAENRVLILDCCFSGRAIEAMSDPASVVSAQVEVAGTYTLTSTAPNAMASAPLGATYTAFTGALLDILRTGVPHGPELLSFRTIYPELDRKLRASGLERPLQRGVRTTDQLALAPNHSYQHAAAGDERSFDIDFATGLLNARGFRTSAAEILSTHPDAVVLRIDLDVWSA